MVYHDSAEARYVAADTELLEQISNVTGAEPLTLSGLEQLPKKVKLFEQLSSERVKPHDIWDRLPIFLVLICILGFEWLIRRASGLV